MAKSRISARIRPVPEQVPRGCRNQRSGSPDHNSLNSRDKGSEKKGAEKGVWRDSQARSKDHYRGGGDQSCASRQPRQQPPNILPVTHPDPMHCGAWSRPVARFRAPAVLILPLLLLTQPAVPLAHWPDGSSLHPLPVYWFKSLGEHTALRV